ncbi:uncharacterized protein HKW66_Vig0152940 [Vigna angularis]|uniref:Uncharacterized protein n=1 Tax=Phaseolus angularis TaxID=3914 RepID=A0A8T0JXA2_PHAAN|nr:uncharacterized protein HKW66_Vig0152940 [Vigna angularis]
MLLSWLLNLGSVLCWDLFGIVSSISSVMGLYYHYHFVKDLNKLAALLCESGENGGFTLIRLTSSGSYQQAYMRLLSEDHVVCLADDGEETWAGYSKPKSFFLYQKKSIELTESVGQEIFVDLSPVELRFDAPVKKFEPLALKAYDQLNRQMSKWQQSFDSYIRNFVFNIDFKGNIPLLTWIW